MLNSLQRMSSIFYPFLYGTVIVMLQLYVYRSMLTTAIAVLALVVMTFWLNYFGFVRQKAG
jgi:predicted RND superfamily exporter protein